MFDMFPQKNPDLSGSQDHGASSHSEGFHVQDPAVSDFDVEPKGGAAFVVGSLPSCLAPFRGLTKIGGKEGFVKADLGQTMAG